MREERLCPASLVKKINEVTEAMVFLQRPAMAGDSYFSGAGPDKTRVLDVPLKLRGRPPNTAMGCQERKALLPDVSHGKPKCRGLRMSTSRPFQTSKPAAGAGKSRTRVWVTGPHQKKWRWGKKRHIPETWIIVKWGST